MRIRAAREAQKMTRKMVVQKMQQFLPESEKAVTTRALMSWEAGEREPRFEGRPELGDFTAHAV